MKVPCVVADRPRCARQGALVYYAALNETVELPCAVDAVPADRIGFTWTLLQEARGEQKFGRDGTTKEVVSTLKKKLIKKRCDPGIEEVVSPHAINTLSAAPLHTASSTASHTSSRPIPTSASSTARRRTLRA